MDNVRVLYVEDDPTDRELTFHHLRQHAPEMEVQVVGTGREAREVMASQRFDLVLLDYRLPDVDGLQLLREFLADAPNVPVVMVTGSGDHEVAVAALKLGASDYVVKKPGYLDRLPTVIREALGRSQQERSRRARNLRVLYAEHESADLNLTLRRLAADAAHLTVETATTGPDTLRTLESGRYDLLLLDYRMPGMNGLEILQAMREKGIRLPVVMITGHRDEETAVQAMKLGAMDYIVKREGYLTQLASSIDRALAQWALREEKEALLVVRDIAREIAPTLDLKEVLQLVATAACSLLRVDRSLLCFLSEDGAELVPAAWRGWSAEAATCLRFRVGQAIPGQAAALRRAVSGVDSLPEALARQAGTTREGMTVVSRLSVPLVGP